MVDITGKKGPVDPSRGGRLDAVDPEDVYDDVTAAISVRVFDPPGEGSAGDAQSDNDGEVRVVSARLESTLDEALTPGFLLNNRFKIVELVHSGGMGHVYKAIDERRTHSAEEQYYVAIKMMRSSVTSQVDTQSALEAEAAKTQSLSHPNIVNVYDFDRHDDQFYIVMEWLVGESVNSLLRRTSGRPLAPHFAWQVIEGIARGLQHAHSKDVVHVDVNPSNIFITDTQEVKLLDFGVSRYESESRDDATEDVAWATRTYASPEVLSGLPPTFADDIFSLGCVAYRLLSGRHPFGGWSSIDAKQADVAPQPIQGLSENRWQIISRALAYEQSERPDTVSAFFTEFPPLANQNLASPFFAEYPVATRATSLHEEPEPGRNYWLPALALAAVVAAVGTWWAWPDGTSSGAAIPAETNLVADADQIAKDGEAQIVDVEVDALLSSAAQAVEEERLVMPDDNNARAHYLGALAIDPENDMALSGLRNISDQYVRRAENALLAEDLSGAVSALTIATETDAQNPAITIVDQLLLAQANVVLANARAAVADGNTSQGRELLLMAEQYPAVDATAVSAITERLEQIERDQRLSATLAVVDADLLAGRLISPAGDNAQESLAQLQNVYGSDPRVLAMTEQVTDRMFNSALIATSEGQFAEAADLLDAVESYDVLAAEISAARTSLQSAMDKAAEASQAALASTALIAAGEPIQQNLLGGVNEQASSESIPSGQPASFMTTSNTPSDAVSESVVEQETPIDEPPAGPQYASFSELSVRNYVDPVFPRRALDARLNGAVELRFDVMTDGSTDNIEIVSAEPRTVFVPSARSAVRQWRFAERDEIVRAQVKLRFDLPPGS